MKMTATFSEISQSTSFTNK